MTWTIAIALFLVPLLALYGVGIGSSVLRWRRARKTGKQAREGVPERLRAVGGGH